MSKDQTAQVDLEITVTAEHDIEFKWEAPNGINGVFGQRKRGNNPAILIGSLNTWENNGNEIWKATKSMTVDNDRDDAIVSETLKPGETYNNRLELWAGPGQGNNNLPPGTYEFTRGYQVQSKDMDEWDDTQFAFDVAITN